MKTIMLPVTDKGSIPQALEILKHGGLVAFPTDTVYGVGVFAFDGKAIGNIYIAKNRPVKKAIAILIGGPEDLDKVSKEVPSMATKLAEHFWPGPLTVIVPKRPDLPDEVSSSSTVGVRVPDHPFARALLAAAGPMAVTSANISGQTSPKSAEDVRRQLGGRIPLILDGGETPGSVPSTVVDCTGTEPVILRDGPIKLKEIQLTLS